MKKVAVGLMVILMVSVSLTDACGDQFQIRPYMAVRGEYNDNIFFSPNSNDAESDYILTLRPGIEITDRTERLNARLRGQVAPFFYKDNSDLDAVDQDYRGRIDYQFTPRLYGGADISYLVDHRPDRDFLATGLVQNADRRDRFHLGGGLGYNLTEITSVGVNYDFNGEDWEKQAQREDVEYQNINLNINQNLSRWLPATNGQVVLGYGNIDRDSAQTDTFSATVGVRHRLSELFRFNLRGGARYVSSDFDVPNDSGREWETGWGAVGSAILRYAGEKTRSNLLLSRDLSPGSGRRSPTVLTRLIGSVNHRFLAEMSVGLRAGIYHNKADRGDFGAQEIDEYTFRVRPNIRWDFYDNFSLTGAYRYTYLNNKARDRNTIRNAVFLEVAYGLPLSDLFDLTGSELRQVVSGAIPPAEPR